MTAHLTHTSEPTDTCATDDTHNQGFRLVVFVVSKGNKVTFALFYKAVKVEISQLSARLLDGHTLFSCV